MVFRGRGGGRVHKEVTGLFAWFGPVSSVCTDTASHGVIVQFQDAWDAMLACLAQELVQLAPQAIASIQWVAPPSLSVQAAEVMFLWAQEHLRQCSVGIGRAQSDLELAFCHPLA